MSSQFDCLNLCRLCLMKDRVQVPIFEDAGEVNQIFLKIHACLPIKLSRDDKLPKKICDDCLCKVELFYQFWNTAVDSEKQLLQWLGMEEMEDKQQGYVTEVLDPNVMKHEGSSDNRLDGNVLQVGGHQNMDLNMINNISIITMPAANEQSFSTVPMGADGTVHIAGPSTSVVHNQAGVAHLQEVDVHHEDVDNIDDGCDNDNGLTVKGEIGEDDRSMEQTYVTLSCDEAGPSGLQQQKLSDISEIAIQQSTDGEHKTGSDNESSSTTMTLYEVKYMKDEATYTFVPIQTSETTATASTSIQEPQEPQEPEKYTCDKCGLKFVSELRLEWHCSTHDPLKNCKTNKKQTRKEKTTADVKVASNSISSGSASGNSVKRLKFICPTCEFTTSERQLMIEHFTAKHCVKSTDLRSTSEEHEQIAEDEEVEEMELTELTCAQCGFSSYDQDDIDFHTCNKPGEEPTSFSCHLCTYECLTRMGLQSHITRKHKPKPGSEVPVRYACDECDYKCSNKNTMYSHKRKHRPKIKRKQSVKQESNRTQCTFYCNECDYTSSKKNALFQHIKKTHGKPQDEHFHAVPGRKDLFCCDQCPYTNKNRYEMKVHIIRKHSNEYNYECEQCGKKYKIKGDLTNHIRFQHREQPIICDVCGKTCGNSNSLYVHQKFAHYKAEFECPICHRRMVSKANLDEHILKQHEQRQDAICEECGKTFTRQSRLKIHMRIHLGIKPHACKLCGKAFSRKTALRQHLLIHTGQRPYACDICGKSFTQKPGLISHRKSHPGTHPPLPRVTIDHVLSDLLTTQDT